MKNNQQFLNIQEASKLLGVHINTLRRWDKDGNFTAVRIGTRGHRKYPKTKILKLIKNQAYPDDLQIKEKPSLVPESSFHFEVSEFPSSNIPVGATYTFNSSTAKHVRNYSHGLHVYPAKYIPHIPRWAFKFTNLKKGSTVLDPFCGCGTTLVEAAISGYKAYGIDINPLAQLLTEAKTTSGNNVSKESILEDLEIIIKNAKKNRQRLPSGYDKDLHDNWKFWFPEETMKSLFSLKIAILKYGKPNLVKFYLACLSNIIKKCSYFNEREIKVRKDKTKTEKSIPDPFLIFRTIVKKNLTGIIDFSKAKIENKGEATVIGTSAKKINLPDNSINLVVTSPPYINAIDYAMAHKYSLFILGLVSADKYEQHCRDYIGITERAVKSKDFGKIVTVGHSDVDMFVNKLNLSANPIDRNRAFIVSHYFNDMKKSLEEAYRVLKPGGYYISVVGDNSIRGEHIPTSLYIQEIAINNVGFELVTFFFHQLKNIRLKVNRNVTGGLIKRERIMILRKI